MYGFIQALDNTYNPANQHLARRWQTWLDYAKLNAATVFYRGQGQVCAVTDLNNQSLQVNDPNQGYKCEGNGTLNDPYEGELFTWFLYFFGGLSQKDKEQLWHVKRPQLVQTEYNMNGVGPITVQKGEL